jgi:phosphatidylglycerophosphate synthase
VAQGVDPSAIINADETAFLLYPHGFYRWARRGAQAVQIHVAGNQKQSYMAMVAVTMNGRKLPLFIIVQGKTVGASGVSRWTQMVRMPQLTAQPGDDGGDNATVAPFHPKPPGILG